MAQRDKASPSDVVGSVDDVGAEHIVFEGEDLAADEAECVVAGLVGEGFYV